MAKNGGLRVAQRSQPVDGLFQNSWVNRVLPLLVPETRLCTLAVGLVKVLTTNVRTHAAEDLNLRFEVGRNDVGSLLVPVLKM